MRVLVAVEGSKVDPPVSREIPLLRTDPQLHKIRSERSFELEDCIVVLDAEVGVGSEDPRLRDVSLLRSRPLELEDILGTPLRSDEDLLSLPPLPLVSSQLLLHVPPNSQLLHTLQKKPPLPQLPFCRKVISIDHRTKNEI